jgi:hypothetical protein
MATPATGQPLFDDPAAYQIMIHGRIAPALSERLEGMAISLLDMEDGTSLSILTGDLSDQAALTGVLNAIYELHLSLVYVFRLPVGASCDERTRPHG